MKRADPICTTLGSPRTDTTLSSDFQFQISDFRFGSTAVIVWLRLIFPTPANNCNGLCPRIFADSFQENLETP